MKIVTLWYYRKRIIHTSLTFVWLQEKKDKKYKIISAKGLFAEFYNPNKVGETFVSTTHPTQDLAKLSQSFQPQLGLVEL